MDLPKHLVDELVKAGASNAAVCAQTESATHVKFANSKIVTTKTWKLARHSVFIEQASRIVTTSLERLDDPKKQAKLLMAMVAKAEPNPDFRELAKGPFQYALGRHYDKKVLDMDPAGMVEETVSASQERGRQRCAGVLERSSDTYRIITSNGIDVEDRGTSLYFSFRAMGQKASGHEVCAARHAASFDYRAAAKRASELAEDRDVKSVQPGSYDVLFSPLAFANIIQRATDAASVFSVESGLSFFENRIGEKIGALTLQDDPTLPDGYASRPFDHEGVPARNVTWLDRGILKTYLHNTSSAKRYDVPATGHSGWIAPSPTNTVVVPGELSDEQLFQGFTGLYVTNVWYTRFQNYASGDFSTIPRDTMLYVKNGVVQHAVSDARISDNMLRILKNVKHLGREVHQVRGWEVDMPVITPKAIVSDVKITRSTA